MASLQFSTEQSEEKVREHINALDDDTLQAQHLVQQGAISVLMLLDRESYTPERVRAMLESSVRIGAIITVECRRRKLATVDMPGTH